MVRPFVQVTSLAVAGLALSAPAEAYGPRETHRWLTRMAAEHLVRAHPGRYDELLEYVDVAADGAEHEDDLVLDGDDDPETLRVMRHFFRPVDQQGLYLEHRGEFPSSLEWVRDPDNPWHWGRGIDAYAAGDIEEAYFVLGHVAHLVQDLTVPAHTHLDIHPPPNGDDYEGYASSMMRGELEADLPRPPADAPIPQFASLEDLWLATANASYWRNRYPGDLRDPDNPRGVIADMFPSIAMHWFYDEWAIAEPPVGRIGQGFFESETPGWFYFKTTDVAPDVTKIAFDPADPSAIELAANDEGARMTELMARDLVPVAILHGAAVMKLYLDEAYARGPEAPGGGADDVPPQGGAAGCAAAPGAPPAPWILVPLLYPLFIRSRRAS